MEVEQENKNFLAFWPNVTFPGKPAKAQTWNGDNFKFLINVDKEKKIAFTKGSPTWLGDKASLKVSSTNSSQEK